MIIGQYEAKLGTQDIDYKEKIDAPYTDLPIDSSFIQLLDLNANSP